MSRFVGHHEYQIDPKGRVSLPSPFRRVASAEPMILLQWQKSHLDLFPEETWAGIRRKLLSQRRASGDGGAYVRRVTANAVEVEPDGSGRIRIPEWLRARAGLDGSVLFVGALDRIELWDPRRFRSVVQALDADGERDALDRDDEHVPNRIFA